MSWLNPNPPNSESRLNQSSLTLKPTNLLPTKTCQWCLHWPIRALNKISSRTRWVKCPKFSRKMANHMPLFWLCLSQKTTCPWRRLWIAESSIYSCLDSRPTPIKKSSWTNSKRLLLLSIFNKSRQTWREWRIDWRRRSLARTWKIWSHQQAEICPLSLPPRGQSIPKVWFHASPSSGYKLKEPQKPNNLTQSSNRNPTIKRPLLPSLPSSEPIIASNSWVRPARA